MKSLILISALLCCGFCGASERKPSMERSGRVLAERKMEMGSGFSLVGRSIQMPSTHWEAIGHFSFLYFRDRLLCECSTGDFSISPSGHYALVQDGPSGKLFLFSVKQQSLSEVTKKYIGSPRSFYWDERKRVVTIAFHQNLANGYPNAKPISVVLP